MDSATPTSFPQADRAPSSGRSMRESLARLRSDGEPVRVTPAARETADWPAHTPVPPKTAQPPADPAAVAPAEAGAPTQTTLGRTQILDATLAVLEEHGYDGATIRRIARQLDCAVGSIYRYFRDKRELLAAVTQRRFQHVLEAAEAKQPWHVTAKAYLHAAIDQPQQYRLMFWLAGCTDRGPAAAPAVVRKLLDAWATQLGDRREAERRWAQLHGGVMLGRSPDELLADFNTTDKPAATTRDDLTLL